MGKESQARWVGIVAYILANLACMGCDPTTSDNARIKVAMEQLVDPSPEVRTSARQSLLKLPSEELLPAARTLIHASSTVKGQEEFLRILYERDPSLIPALVSNLVSHTDSHVRATTLRLIAKGPSLGSLLGQLRPLLSDPSLVVQVYAANLLRGLVEEKLPVECIIRALDSEELDQGRHPPTPVCLLAKELSGAWEPKADTIELLPKALPASVRADHHLVDLRAFLRGDIKRFVYMHIGNPTPEEMTSLNELRNR